MLSQLIDIFEIYLFYISTKVNVAIYNNPQKQKLFGIFNHF